MTSAKVIFCAPAGWPGVGLLLLRMLVGVTLIAQTVTELTSSELSASRWALAVLVLLGAACLLLGFVTPVTAVLIGLVMFGRREILIPNASRSPKS